MELSTLQVTLVKMISLAALVGLGTALAVMIDPRMADEFPEWYARLTSSVFIAAVMLVLGGIAAFGLVL